MSEPFVGEIRMFAGNFAPRGWAFCEGQLLAISGNDALFSLLGTIYGGDGRTTFGLPDLRGRIPIHAGTGPGLSQRRLGERGGTENETLAVNELPSHTHVQRASSDLAGRGDPSAALPARQTIPAYSGFESQIVSLAPDTIGSAGGSQPHANLQPYLCVHFIIALVGIYPSRQ